MFEGARHIDGGKHTARPGSEQMCNTSVTTRATHRMWLYSMWCVPYISYGIQYTILMF